MNIGDLVLRTPLQRFGNRGVVLAIYATKCRVKWAHTRQSSLLSQSAVRVVTANEYNAELERVFAAKQSEIAQYKYCAVHHQRLNGDGTCVRCAEFPTTIYTAGDTTVRAYDGPEK